ncbi:hypothetical protein GY45DRAFT_590695 [Cubamyces sp. BRFM 1775]|nr:hypothetical protein GY45DRAFT_590695 [Cubamyces sp. BRFM 1775]
MPLRVVMGLRTHAYVTKSAPHVHSICQALIFCLQVMMRGQRAAAPSKFWAEHSENPQDERVLSAQRSAGCTAVSARRSTPIATTTPFIKTISRPPWQRDQSRPEDGRHRCQSQNLEDASVSSASQGPGRLPRESVQDD